MSRPSDAHDTCLQCGFNGAELGDAEVLTRLGSLGPRWAELLTDAGPEVRTRPAPDVWSGIEYAVHSHDIIELHVVGVTEALSGRETDFGDLPEDPAAPDTTRPMAHDAAAASDALGRQASALAEAGAAAPVEWWGRGITVGGHRLDVRRLLEHALHDSEHHLLDVRSGLAAIRAGA